jgi:hypothetical protein
MIPALRADFRAALEQLDDALIGLGRHGYLREPWMGDETSNEVAVYYTGRALDDPDSSYQSLQRYRAEINRILATLQRMEDHYRRTDGDNAARWGLRA